ncbi:MAG: DNA-directed RNA polymerase subunit alpha [Bacteroidota bacterium]
MATFLFQKPEKVIMLHSTDTEGQFEFRPLEHGYGVTIGNAFRRILLASLEGYAITGLRIDNIDYEFSTIKGILEDVTEIVLNLKQVRFKQQVNGVDTEKITISLSEKKQFTAGDIGKFTSNFMILNPELVICNMEENVKLKFEITINKGRGYVPAEENKPLNSPIGFIPIDSIYTPIRHVKYTVENYRVEQKTDYEKLILDIKTDGSIHPKDSLKEAARILIQHFVLFSDEKIIFNAEEKKENDSFDEHSLHLCQLLKSRLIDMDLSVRALNCLKAADVETLADLVSFNRMDLLKFRNFGKKSLTELEDLVNTKGLHFGMDVSKYGFIKEKKTTTINR